MNDNSALPAALYVVATPIGNLDDLSTRAASVLCQVDAIAAEDTRVSLTLLRKIGANPEHLFSAHDHNQAQAADKILSLLAQGKSVAMISDAGTPGISDPGANIVAAVRAAGFTLCSIPGPSAVATLLALSANPDGRYWFEGFLPASSSGRKERLKTLAANNGQLVVYESPHRIRECLTDAAQVLGEHTAVLIGRELTKQYEETFAGTTAQALHWLDQSNRERGEFVLAFNIQIEKASANFDLAKAFMTDIVDRVGTSAATKLCVKYFGVSRSQAYEWALSLKNSTNE
jgi:16S rRNA (cytidine1402-2'-O)-methyltransferase